MRRSLLALALVALIVPSAAVASSPNNWTVSAYSEYGGASCGNHIEGAPLLALITFTRSGGHMDLHVEIAGGPAVANTDYILSLWNAGNCTQIGGDVGTVTTDGFASASVTFENVQTKGAKTFFAALWSTVPGYSDTTIVP